MEDSTATTIKFLRARLLAERSVSRTARQRAYELAKRVTELEKQLKFVSLQRKKAEKAAVDVLAILEKHGTSDLSETFDSSSDEEEISSDFKDGKQAEKSHHVKIQESDTEGFSGSEVESSSVNGKSLSWKSSKNSSSRFLEKKFMDASRRRRNSITSAGSSPRRVGKSCRQIRRNEHRSVGNGSENDDASNAYREDDGQTSSEGVPNPADVALKTPIELKTHEKKDPPEVPTSSRILKNHDTTNHLIVKHHGANEEMERALEHQARFIARYEAEEKAQKEWEDKFRENNGSTPDSCDPGTHSDVTEEREEFKTQARAQAPARSTSKLTAETLVGLVDANGPKTASPVQPSSHIDTEPLVDQKSSGLNRGVSANQDGPQDPAPGSGMSDEPTLGTHDKLGSVLEALQQAKLSLKQNLDKSGERFLVPSSSVGLFRVPTDYEYTGRVNSLTFDSRLGLTKYPTEPSLDDRFRIVPTFPYQETSPTFPTQRLSAFHPRSYVGPSVLDGRQDVGPLVFDRRSDVGPSAYDPRSDVGVGPSVFDQRFYVGSSVLDRRHDVGPLGFDRRSDVGLSAYDPRSDVGMGSSAYGPRSEMGSPFAAKGDDGFTRFADHPQSSAGLPSSSIPRSIPGVERPLRARSLYNDYTGTNTYG